MRSERTIRDDEGWTLQLHVTTNAALHTKLYTTDLEYALRSAGEAFAEALTKVRRTDKEVSNGL